MRTVVIVLLDPTPDNALGLIEVLVFVEPHLLFFFSFVTVGERAVPAGILGGGLSRCRYVFSREVQRGTFSPPIVLACRSMTVSSN